MHGRTEVAGLSLERLAHIDHFLQTQYLDTGKLKGAVVLVHRRGETAHLGVLGAMDAERGRPMRADTLFRIYSMTKPVTSVAFMMLVEQGLVALDDPVAKYIPAWKNLGVYDGGFMETFRTKPCERPMLIVDLLRHTSGLTYGFQQRSNIDAAYRKLGIGEIEVQGTLDSMIEALAGLPLEFSPGTAWNYSVSTDVLGYLIGKISGQPFEQFLRTRLFDPLEMADTGFYAPPGEADRLAACYTLTPKGVVLQDDPAKSPYLKPPSFVSGGGGLVSTAQDYLRFCRMVLNGGELDGRRYLSPKTIRQMGLNHLPGGQELATMSRSLFSEAAYAGLGFGLGFSTTVDPAATLIPATVGDLSWGGAASTFFWIDPKEELIAILMTQLIPSSAYPIRRQLRTLVYSALTEMNG
ncbi:serine hydrolase domain-containing protein [Phenylobacterium montanum]|uniref:Beta-lactamase family protein n=1 Tax=Phenylobacterium montanum TaxID=2823693 RepID=A0A975FWK3_9CAUL|nr:serine hydrolase domain-containing protein [Caulobacter sp. S6]QUD86620.1 beta-lactamase family protein [Caulobacter sp. S6]